MTRCEIKTNPSERKMSRIHILLQQQQQKTHQKDGYLVSYYYPPPPFSTPVSFSPPYSTTNSFHKQSSSSSGSKISPAVLFIIVILAVLFFISGLLHLLVRFLIKHPSPPSTSSSNNNNNNRYAEFATSDALQRQLQQLFHLHDSGLDQAFIDALPVFQYREIVGPKEPFDCAVCLSEFSDKDNLRLLPVCSHAFHIACIDTWLLSNSTCPLCRGTLFANPGPGFSADNPVFAFDDDNAKEEEIEEEEEEEEEPVAVKAAKGVLPVRLGKFRRVGPEPTVGETSASSSSRLDARRCFSMGSYEYVLGDSVLRVPLRKVQEQQQQHRGGGGGSDNSGGDSAEGKKISGVSKGESFSVSKIWLWPKKGKFSPSDSDSGMPSSLNVDLPWMGRTQQGY